MRFINHSKYQPLKAALENIKHIMVKLTWFVRKAQDPRALLTRIYEGLRHLNLLSLRICRFSLNFNLNFVSIKQYTASCSGSSPAERVQGTLLASEESIYSTATLRSMDLMSERH